MDFTLLNLRWYQELMAGIFYIFQVTIVNTFYKQKTLLFTIVNKLFMVL